MTSGTWLRCWHPHPDRSPVVLCLPPAGAGCGQFQAWQAAWGEEVAVLGVQLPGREDRWGAPGPESIDEAIEAITAELQTMLSHRSSLVIFGHSFGALLGFEITRSLASTTPDLPVRALVAASCRPPNHWVDPNGGLARNEDEIEDVLAAARTTAGELDEESRELALEVLRRDAQLSRSYAGRALSSVTCALEAWGGDDDPLVSSDHVRGWRDLADGPFRVRMFPGGHYACLDDPTLILPLLDQLARRPAREKLHGDTHKDR